MKKAIVLLSGGLDSATCLYIAKAQKYKVHGLILKYGPRHVQEIESAKKVARKVKCPYKVVTISLPWQGSSLLDKSKKLPSRARISPKEIPSTYVPARNIIFLSFAASYAEAIDAEAVFIGANALDYSGYPDCRPEFMKSFQAMMRRGMKSGVKGKKITIKTPIIGLTKAQIIRKGTKLGVPYHLTWSCYKGGKKPCGVCDSCRLRAKGFQEADIKDPAVQ